MVGDIKGVVVLDNEGQRIIAKYYNSPRHLETNAQQKLFERQLHFKSNKLSNSSKINMYENDIMTVESYTAIFRVYTDMSIYILGNRDDNELVLSQVLEVIHECFDKLFKHSIERKSLISNMTAVILVIDEIIDSGIVMTTDYQTILKRINIHAGSAYHGSGSSQSEQQTESQSSLFSSLFSSARSQLAKTIQLS